MFGTARPLSGTGEPMKRPTGILKSIALMGIGAAAALAATTQVPLTVGEHRPALAAPGSPAPSAGSPAPSAGSPAAAPGGSPTAMQPSLPPPSQAQINDAKSFSRTFTQVAEQLKPSVVSLVVE